MRDTLFLLCLLLLGVAASAQRPRTAPHGERHEQRTERRGPRHHGTDATARGERLDALLDSLDLTDEQRTRVAALTTQLRADVRALRETGNPDARTERKALMEAYRNNVRAVLTPAQQTRLDEARERRDAVRAERRDSATQAARARHAELKPMYVELAQLKRERITGVLAELRTDFDRELSDAEHGDIEALRAAMREQRRNMKAAAGSKDGSNPDDKAARREAVRGAREAFAAEHAAEIAAVKQIAERHATRLAEVRADLKAREADWAAEADAIRAKYLTADELARQQQRRDRMKARGEDGARKGGHTDAHREAHAQRGALRFLLMRPGEVDEAGADEAVGIEADEAEFNVYPNPAAAATTVAFDVRADGPVRVELVDASGRVLGVLLDERRVAGPAQLSVELPDDAGSTFLRITDASGVRTQVVARTR